MRHLSVIPIPRTDDHMMHLSVIPIPRTHMTHLSVIPIPRTHMMHLSVIGSLGALLTRRLDPFQTRHLDPFKTAHDHIVDLYLIVISNYVILSRIPPPKDFFLHLPTSWWKASNLEAFVEPVTILLYRLYVRAVIQGTSTFEQLAEFVGSDFELLKFDHLTGIYLSTTEVTSHTGLGRLRLAMFMQHNDVMAFDAICLPTDYLHNFSACTTRLKELGVHVGRKRQLYQVRAALLAAQEPCGSLGAQLLADNATTTTTPTTTTTRPPLTILQWNACSIKSRREYLLNLVDEHHPDILIISETHLAARDMYRLAGYSQVSRLDRSEKGGGQLILVKSDHTFINRYQQQLSGLFISHFEVGKQGYAAPTLFQHLAAMHLQLRS